MSFVLTVSKLRKNTKDDSLQTRVKLECLRLLATLRLDPARMQLISGFVDTYLRLSANSFLARSRSN